MLKHISTQWIRINELNNFAARENRVCPKKISQVSSRPLGRLEFCPNFVFCDETDLGEYLEAFNWRQLLGKSLIPLSLRRSVGAIRLVKFNESILVGFNFTGFEFSPFQLKLIFSVTRMAPKGSLRLSNALEGSSRLPNAPQGSRALQKPKKLRWKSPK